MWHIGEEIKLLQSIPALAGIDFSIVLLYTLRIMEAQANGDIKETAPVPRLFATERMPGGATSNVYRVELDGSSYAVKTSPFSLEKERRILSRLQSPHILPVLGSGQAHLDTSSIPNDGNNGAIVHTLRFRFIPNTLSRRLDSLPIQERRRILEEQREAMNYMHGQGVVHTDIKADNVLLDGDTSYLSDFGNARDLSLPEQKEEFERRKQKDITDFEQMEKDVLQTESPA